jgi:hypothetical protein
MTGSTFSKVTGNLAVECIYQQYDQQSLAYLSRYLLAKYGKKITEANPQRNKIGRKSIGFANL